MSTISNFPQHVAIYRPAENGYQVIFAADGKFQILTSTVTGGVWYNVAKSKDYPQDDTFQVAFPSGKDGKEVYYWPTGFDLVRNVPKSWPKGSAVRYPIFQFLTPPVSLSLTVIPAVASGEMNAAWSSAMKVIRSAALSEQREFKDMPGLDFGSPSVPVLPAPVLAEMPPLEDMSEFMSPTDPTATGTHWATLDTLMEAAKRIWWTGWRSDGPFRKQVRLLDLDMLEPMEFLHYLRLVSSINKRMVSSGGKMINLSFTTEEIEKMKGVKAEESVRSEIIQIMSQYV
jgi:hypothetical protein